MNVDGKLFATAVFSTMVCILQVQSNKGIIGIHTRLKYIFIFMVTCIELLRTSSEF